MTEKCKVCRGIGHRTAMDATGRGVFNETCIYCNGTGIDARATPADQGTALESMTRMFHEAYSALGLINEALGLDPDDGGAEPILDAIASLKAERDQWVDANFSATSADHADEQQAYETGYRHGMTEYQSAMGYAAEKYLSTFPHAHPLPAQFRWSEIFKVMMNCATAPQPTSDPIGGITDMVDAQGVRDAALEQAARICEKLAEERFQENGITEWDTNASYYSGRCAEEYETRDEEDQNCADQIRLLKSAPQSDAEGVRDAKEIARLRLELDAAIDSIAQLVASSQSARNTWISIIDRLPELGSVVIVTGWAYNKPDGERYTLIARLYSDDKFHAEETGDELYPPTHWQPLPAPPQKPVSDEVSP